MSLLSPKGRQIMPATEPNIGYKNLHSRIALLPGFETHPMTGVVCTIAKEKCASRLNAWRGMSGFLVKHWRTAQAVKWPIVFLRTRQMQ